ncbi:MAG: hypothetical protein K6C34_04985 [Alphaproteobacteria bacterium]|nr:hypothetical protein [Alphaproteobacteria bacterium]
MTQNYKTRLAAATMAALSMLLGADIAMGSAYDTNNNSRVEYSRLENNLQVREGELSKENFTVKWQQAVAQGINGIIFSGTTIGEEAAQAIAEQISNGSITSLSFHECYITSEAIRIVLAACCAPGARVRSFGIENEQFYDDSPNNPLITDEEAGLITNLLRTSHYLEGITIAGTALTDVGAEVIAEGLESSTSLQVFNFLFNSKVTPAGLKRLRDIVNSRGLSKAHVDIRD